ncbi:hypothetical protein ACHAXT_010699 [Thalassiosira profunda]
MLSTDYLVVGAGAASCAFVDTILTEQSEATLTLVDQHSAPGGHWNDAYGFCRLHAPSLLYGVASEQLEGNWLKLLLLKRTLFFNHRATRDEILAYYSRVMKKWAASGRVSYYPNCTYNARSASDAKIHCFSDNDGSNQRQIEVTAKVVFGHLTACTVPSQHPPEFSVDDSLALKTPNDIYDLANDKAAVPRDKTYVVLGGGKTATDTICFLQNELSVQPKNIRWVVPNQQWLTSHEGGLPALPEQWPRKLVEFDLDVGKAALAMEKEGGLTRLDPDVPTVAKGLMPIVGKDEIKVIRNVDDVIRRGRISSIVRQGDDAAVSFAKGGDPLLFPAADTIFVHCTSPGPYSGNIKGETSVFPSDDVINLLIMLTPPIQICMSMTALLESRLQQKKLNLDAGRELLKARNGGSDDDANLSDREVLDCLIRGISMTAGVNEEADAKKLVGTLITTGLFCVLLDEDCTVAYNWLKSNRLSILTVPGNRIQISEDISLMASKAEKLGYSPGEAGMLSLLATKLKPLEGK